MWNMDQEIAVMQEIAEALDGLDHGTRIRVLRWADERFGKQTGAFEAVLSFGAAVTKLAREAGAPEHEVYRALAKHGADLVPEAVALSVKDG
jgi:hypothetical protein